MVDYLCPNVVVYQPRKFGLESSICNIPQEWGFTNLKNGVLETQCPSSNGLIFTESNPLVF